MLPELVCHERRDELSQQALLLTLTTELRHVSMEKSAEFYDRT